MSQFTRTEANVLKKFFLPIIRAGIIVHEQAEEGPDCDHDFEEDNEFTKNPPLILSPVYGRGFFTSISRKMHAAWVAAAGELEVCPIFADASCRNFVIQPEDVFQSGQPSEALLAARDALIDAHLSLTKFGLNDLCDEIAKKIGVVVVDKLEAKQNEDGTISFMIANKLLWNPAATATRRINKMFKEAGLELSITQQLQDKKKRAHSLWLTFDPARGGRLTEQLRTGTSIDAGSQIQLAYRKTMDRRIEFIQGVARYGSDCLEDFNTASDWLRETQQSFINFNRSLSACTK